MSQYPGFAAVGTDGMRPVVWGVGETEEAAEADALRELGETGSESPLVVVEITAFMYGRIQVGCVDAGDLGIRLTRSQLRELTEEA